MSKGYQVSHRIEASGFPCPKLFRDTDTLEGHEEICYSHNETFWGTRVVSENDLRDQGGGLALACA